MNSSPAEPRRSSPGRRTSDAFLRRALEMAHLGWWQTELHSTTDLTKNITSWSDEVFRIFGYEPKAFKPTTEIFFAHIPPEDHAAVNAAVQRAFAETKEYDLEHRIVRADGAVRLVEERASLEVDAAGTPVRLVGTITDVTDRRKIEEALRGSAGGSQFLGQLVEHSHDAIMSAASDGVITTWNPAAEKMFGWKASEIIGRHANVLAAPDRQAEVDANIIRAGIRGESIGAVETVRARRDGTLIDVELSASPIRDADGNILGASAIIRDITQQKRFASQLQHAQRLESVGRLAGGVAHDFNNLLMAISGYAELVMMDLPDESPAREDMRALLASAERGARLTRQLLAFGRRQVLNPIALDLNAVLRDMEGVLRPLTAGDVTLRLHLSQSPTLVRADRAQIEQVIVNLVANARDAMPHGGVLDIETKVVDVGADGPVYHPTIAPGRYVKLALKDTGIGMDADVQSRLFEPFFSTKPRGTSTGMGLATTYGIVKQSGGFITVESEPERGSTFRIFLPLRPAMPNGEAADGAGLAAAPGGDETILLVEDDDAVRVATKAMLERLGYAVLDAATPSEALRILREHTADIDLLLTDVMLPEMTGTRLAEVVRAERPGIKVVRMSGFPDAVDRIGPAAAGGLPELQKPFSAETLARTLRGAFAR